MFADLRFECFIQSPQAPTFLRFVSGVRSAVSDALSHYTWATTRKAAKIIGKKMLFFARLA
jgi:hypothetical protein